jgi:hypothetical protein
MNQSKKPNRSRKRSAEFERSIQLQIREYQARYYPGGRDVTAALWAEKFPADTDASSRQQPSKRER